MRKVQHLQDFSAFFLSVELEVGHTLPKLARYQLRHTSLLIFISVDHALPLSQKAMRTHLNITAYNRHFTRYAKYTTY